MSFSFNCSNNKKKIILIGVIFIALLTFFITKKSMSNPHKVVSKFQNAIVSNDKSELVSVLYCNDKRLKIDKKTVEPLVEYFKNNPSELNKVMESLNVDAVDLHDSKETVLYNTSKDTFKLNYLGKKFLFFPEYKIVITPGFFKVNCNLKDVRLLLNGKEIAQTDVANYKKEFGPYMPGKYNLKASYKGKDESYDVDLINNNEKEIEVLANAKDEEVVKEGNTNINPDSKAIVNDDGGEDVKKIEQLVHDYSVALCNAIRSGNFSIVEPYLYPGTQIYNEQKKYVPNAHEKGINEDLHSLDMSYFEMNPEKTAGKITTAEVYTIYVTGSSYKQAFRNYYTYKYNSSLKKYQLETIAD